MQDHEDYVEEWNTELDESDPGAIYVNTWSAGPAAPLTDFNVTRKPWTAWNRRLAKGQSTKMRRGMVIYRTWIITNLGNGQAEMHPRRSALHRALRGKDSIVFTAPETH